jgi:hypothetical protein
MKHRALFFAAALVLSGCYASTSPEDTRVDPAADPAADPHTDAWPDAYPDPGAEPDIRPEIYTDVLLDYPIDYPPDIQTDIPMTCLPSSPVRTSFTIDYEDYPMGDVDFTQRCTLTSAGGTTGLTVIELDCVTETGERVPHHIEVATDPAAYIYLWTGGEVVFTYRVNCPWWCDKWFTIGYGPGSMTLAGVSASTLVPYDADPAMWYEPLGVWAVQGLCPWEPADCSDSERLALELTFGGMTTQIFDQGFGYIGMMMSYQVFVAMARMEHNIRCTDMPDSWFDALFISIPEG